MAKALKMASVGPVMVTILSGQFPSEMLILAPLWRGGEQSPDGRWGEAAPGVGRLLLTADAGLRGHLGGRPCHSLVKSSQHCPHGRARWEEGPSGPTAAAQHGGPSVQGAVRAAVRPTCRATARGRPRQPPHRAPGGPSTELRRPPACPGEGSCQGMPAHLFTHLLHRLSFLEQKPDSRDAGHPGVRSEHAEGWVPPGLWRDCRTL